MTAVKDTSATGVISGPPAPAASAPKPAAAPPPVATTPDVRAELLELMREDAKAADYKSLPGYAHASPAEQKRIDAVMKQADKRAGMLAVLKSPAWIEHPDARGKILGLCEHVRSGNDVDAIATACTMLKHGVPLILDRASDGKTLLDHLDRLGKGPLCADAARALAPKTQADLVGAIVRECVEPGRIKQGNMGSCGPTSIQYVLVTRHPAEYARLTSGLVLDGRVKMRGGKELTLHPQSMEPSHSGSRSPSERVFQSALYAAADPGMTWNPDKHTEKAGNSALDTVPSWLRVLAFILFPVAIVLALLKGGGVSPDKLDELSEQVLGVRYSHDEYYLGAPDDDHTIRNRLDELKAQKKLVPGGGVFISVSDFGGERHWLEVEGMKNGKPPELICRNPWGPAKGLPPPRPGDLVGPPAPEGVRWDDPARGTIRMPLDAEGVKNIETIDAPSS